MVRIRTRWSEGDILKLNKIRLLRILPIKLRNSKSSFIQTLVYLFWKCVFFWFLSQIFLVWTPCPWWWVAHGSVARRSNDNRERYPSREIRNWCVRGVHRKGAVNRQAYNSGTNSALGASCSGYREQTNIAYSSRVRVLFQSTPLTHVLFDRSSACYVPEKGDQAFQR